MSDFRLDGYEIVCRLLDRQQVNNLKGEIERYITSESTHGIRHLTKKVPAVDRLAHSKPILNCLKAHTPKKLKLVRAIYFNKTIDNNWFVGWHQDKTISVREQIDTPKFINWTVKQGIVHVRPSLTVMQSIITLRIHLDRANSNNGALQVIPASHQSFLSSEEISRIAATSKPVICNVDAGDGLVMSPLILHRSLKAKFNSLTSSKRDRAVIHLEYAYTKLPNNLQWA